MKKFIIHDSTVSTENDSLSYFIKQGSGGISGSEHFFREHELKAGDIVEIKEYDNIVARAGLSNSEYNYGMSNYLAMGKYANKAIVSSLYKGDMFDKMGKAYSKSEESDNRYSEGDMIMVAGHGKETYPGEISQWFGKHYRESIARGVKASSSFMISGNKGIDAISRKYLEACGYEKKNYNIKALTKKDSPKPGDNYEQGDQERRQEISIYPEERTGREIYSSTISIYHPKGKEIALRQNKGRSMVVKISEGPYFLEKTVSSEWAALEGSTPSFFEKLKDKGYLQVKFKELRKKEKSKGIDTPKELTNHSGGARGSDRTWEEIGRQYGFTKHHHYYHGKKTAYGNYEISDLEIQSGIREARKAALSLAKKFPEKYASLMGRNWFQVKNSEKIYAIGRILREGEIGSKKFMNKSGKMIVDGGTGYAVEMGISQDKTVYVFHQENEGLAKGWYKWDGKQFTSCPTPTLSNNYAGIGTRKINSDGIKAIEDVYEKTVANLQKGLQQKVGNENFYSNEKIIYQELNVDEHEFKKALAGPYVQQNFFDGKPYLKGVDDTGKKLWGKYEAKIPGASSLQMVREGVRTETIRGPRQQRYNKGKLVVMHDVNKKSPTFGDRVLVRITSEPYKANKKDFLKHEGWSEKVWNDRKNQLLSKGWEAYRYEYIGDIDKFGNLKFPGKSLNKTKKNIVEPNL